MKKITKRKPSLSKLVNTEELCKDLVRMAGFMLDPKKRDKIYKAVRQLQLLDKVAADAGILPR